MSIAVQDISRTLPWRKGLPVPRVTRWQHRKLSDIDWIVVHHAIGPPNQKPEAINAYHINHNKWPRIGYHYVINARGEVFKTNVLTDITYHAGTPKSLVKQYGDTNRRSVGILLTGNFDTGSPTAAQLHALVELIKLLRKSYPKIGVAGVKGHTECPGYSWKSCPGKNFDLVKLRRLIQE